MCPAHSACPHTHSLLCPCNPGLAGGYSKVKKTVTTKKAAAAKPKAKATTAAKAAAKPKAAAKKAVSPAKKPVARKAPATKKVCFGASTGDGAVESVPCMASFCRLSIPGAALPLQSAAKPAAKKATASKKK